MVVRPHKLVRALKRFRRARRGSAAVEMALVLPMFFLLTFGLAEVAMIGFAQTSLDNAVSQTARQIRTGQAQMGGLTAGAIEDQLCANFNRFLGGPCEANLFIDVNTYPSYLAAAEQTTSPIQNNEFQDDGFRYRPGGASDIVVVRAYFRWKIMTPMFESVFHNVNGGERIMISTMMFRNEPFQ
jgi:Flp pilus assembly protein TadG